MSYIKKTWVDGEVITADGLNNMETGILDAHKAADAAQSAAEEAQSASGNISNLEAGVTEASEAAEAAQSTAEAAKTTADEALSALGAKADADLSNVDSSVVQRLIAAAGCGLPVVVATSTDGITYTATADGITELAAGLTLMLIPDTASTSTAVKLNLNGLGAKYVYQSVSTATSTVTTPNSTSWLTANYPIMITYTGSMWKTVATRGSATDLYGTLAVTKGGTGYTSIADTTYTTARYRASALYSSETTPSNNGVINWTYE